MTLGVLSPRALSPARRRTHRAVQWLARMARSYLPPRAGDAHTAFVWVDAPVSSLADEDEGASPHIALAYDIPVELNIIGAEITMRYAPGLHQLWFGNPERPNNVFNLTGSPDEEQVRDLPLALQSMGGDGTKFRADLPYTDEIPADAVATAEEVAEFCRYYSLFARVLAVGERGGPVRLWPRRFDLARLIQLDGGRSIGVGLAPDDAHIDQPFLYIAPAPNLTMRTLPAPPPGLRWHQREGWTALVATAEEIMLGEGAEAHIADAIASGVALCETALD